MQALRSYSDVLNHCFHKTFRWLVITLNLSTSNFRRRCYRLMKNPTPAMGLFLQHRGSLNVTPEPGTLASPRNLIKVQVLDTCPRPVNWKAMAKSDLILQLILVNAKFENSASDALQSVYLCLTRKEEPAVTPCGPTEGLHLFYEDTWQDKTFVFVLYIQSWFLLSKVLALGSYAHLSYEG